MKVQIIAAAPTIYQTASLRSFSIGCIANGDGSYSGSREFNSIKEAHQYFKDLAIDYYDSDKKAISRHLGKDSLTLDAVTAIIVKLDNNFLS